MSFSSGWLPTRPNSRKRIPVLPLEPLHDRGVTTVTAIPVPEGPHCEGLWDVPAVVGRGGQSELWHYRTAMAAIASIVLHRALPDLQRMKLLLFCCRVVGTEVGILFGAIKPDL